MSLKYSNAWSRMGLQQLPTDHSGTFVFLPAERSEDLAVRRKWSTQAGRFAKGIEWEILQGKRRGSSALPAPADLAAKRELPLDAVAQAYEMLREGGLIAANRKDGSWKVSPQKHIRRIVIERAIRLQLSRIKPGDKFPPRDSIVESLNISPNVVSSIMKKLRNERLVLARPRIGVYAGGFSDLPSVPYYDSSTKFGIVAESILAYILEENLAPGALLPSGKELAKVHGVNHATVHKAYGRLKEQGLVQLTDTGGRNRRWVVKQFPDGKKAPRPRSG